MRITAARRLPSAMLDMDILRDGPHGRQAPSITPARAERQIHGAFRRSPVLRSHFRVGVAPRAEFTPIRANVECSKAPQWAPPAWLHPPSCPRLSRASTSFLRPFRKRDVDGRDKPGHDFGELIQYDRCDWHSLRPAVPATQTGS